MSREARWEARQQKLKAKKQSSLSRLLWRNSGNSADASEGKRDRSVSHRGASLVCRAHTESTSVAE